MSQYGRGGIDLRAAGAALRSSPAPAPRGAAASGSTPSESPPVSSLALTDGVGFEPTRAMPTRFPVVRLKPLGHPS